LTLTNEEIISWLDRMDRESRALKEDLLTLCWYMRGGITYDDAMLLSHNERKLIGKLIDKNLETTKKTGMPFF